MLPYSQLPWYKQLFCKHYYVLVEDKFNVSGKRQINAMGYYSMKSQCRLCGKVIEHD
jgi:hypothetical protein